ncbi:MAG: hypothetical protein WDA02_02595 [Saccharofermentanales bacterium]
MSDRDLQPEQPVSLLTVISNPGKADAMARFALQQGARRACHFFAHGTVPGHLLSLLGLSGVRREMITLTVPQEEDSALMDSLCEHFQIGRELHGIAFLHRPDTGAVNSPDFYLIAVIVNEGEGEYVVESARRCHPVGASILKAMGTADHSRRTFDFEIVPQKEIVLIVTPASHIEAIYSALYHELHSDQPGRGILFALALERVAGLLDMAPDCENGDQEEVAAMPREADAQKWVALFTVSDRGKTAAIMDTVERSGGTGATVLHCRQTDDASGGWIDRLAHLEKEITLIITEADRARTIQAELTAQARETGEKLDITQLDVSHFVKLSDLRD